MLVNQPMLVNQLMRGHPQRAVVLGANGAMGAGSGAVFAAAGVPTTFLARTRDKAIAGRERAEDMLKSTAIRALIDVGSYDDDLARAVAEADLILEALVEDLDTKRAMFEKVDRHRKPDAIVATVSSGLSIAAMCRDRSPGFGRSFLGMHLYNPPNVIVGCELIAHPGTDPEVVAAARRFLVERGGREVVETSDMPAFAGNRVGFKVLNEVAQLAEEHGVAFIDYLIGPYTGRAMPPLATIDLVGWDVHRAIVDNVHAKTDDEAHAAFVLPSYMADLIAAGHLGNKTPERAASTRTQGKERLVLDPKSGSYGPPPRLELPPFVERMRALHHVGRYGDALDVLPRPRAPRPTWRARVVLGYVSYALTGRVGDVVREPRDVDRIMGFGFNWAPPGLLADFIGLKRTVTLLEARACRCRASSSTPPSAASPCSPSRTSTSAASSSPEVPRDLRSGRIPDRLRPQLDEGGQAHRRHDPRGRRGRRWPRPGSSPREVEVGHVGNFAAELYSMQGHLGAFLVEVDPAFSRPAHRAPRGRVRVGLASPSSPPRRRSRPGATTAPSSWASSR